ncbi:hypothetical protein GCM10009839_77580 [Catenulispora yoronensis]|uniref:Uncharacterized protein n=1 Tax=Catenulispora yoronensis TaxID=450799 RepID=A0ABN2VCV1_9ACTN
MSLGEAGNAPTLERIDLELSDPSQLGSVRDWLRAVPGIEVTTTAGEPGPGELGGTDTLSIIASSAGLISAIKVLPDIIRARRVGFQIKTEVRGKPFELNAANVEELLPVLERLLDE